MSQTKRKEQGMDKGVESTLGHRLFAEAAHTLHQIKIELADLTKSLIPLLRQEQML